jgi:hypothetical protein
VKSARQGHGLRESPTQRYHQVMSVDSSDQVASTPDRMGSGQAVTTGTPGAGRTGAFPLLISGVVGVLAASCSMVALALVMHFATDAQSTVLRGIVVGGGTVVGGCVGGWLAQPIISRRTRDNA